MDKRLFFRTWKQLSMIFVFGFLGGCIYFNVLWRLQGNLFRNEWCIALNHIVDLTMGEKILVLQNYMIKGFFLQLFIIVLGFSRIGRIVFQGVTAMLGIFVGAMETLLLLSCQIQEGIPYFLKNIIFFGVPITVFLCGMILSVEMSGLKKESMEKTKKWKRIQLKKYLFWNAWLVIVYAVYIFIIYYVNNEEKIFFKI